MKIIDRKFLKVPTKTCHAATIEFYKDEPVFAWFGSDIREGASDNHIYIQFRDEISVIVKDNMPKWNPIFFYDKYNNAKKNLYLFFKSGIFCNQWQTFVNIIEDVDFEFKSPEDWTCYVLPAGLNGPVKTKPIYRNGYIYCGSSVETSYHWASYIEKYSTEIEKNNIKFISRSNPLHVNIGRNASINPPYGLIQPSLWLQDDILHAFFRSSRDLGKIFYSQEIEDNVWSQPVATNILNPNSGIDTVFFEHRLFLVHNPSETLRMPLAIVEMDSDFNIVDKFIVQETVEGGTYSQELSYPYMILNNGHLHLVYTYGRSKIEYVTISI